MIDNQRALVYQNLAVLQRQVVSAEAHSTASSATIRQALVLLSCGRIPGECALLISMTP
jgi:hypothetical protein